MKSRQNYAFASVVIIVFCLIVWWVVLIKQGNMPYIDQWTRSFVDRIANTSAYTFFRYVTELGSKSFVQPFTIMMSLIIWFMYRDFRPAFIFGFGVLGTHILNKLLKEMVARERPSISATLNAEGYSFPSGHSMVSIVCYGLLAYFVGMQLRSNIAQFIAYLSLAILILLIGVSRYIINVHYLTDIIAGYTFGGILLFYLMKLYKQLELKRKKT